VILATWETEIRRIKIQSHLGQKVHNTPSPKYQSKTYWKCGSISRVPAFQVRSPEFKTPNIVIIIKYATDFKD
jgi:hypothetical protein